MSFLWLMQDWKNGDFKEKGEYLLLHFLTQKMKISNVGAINSIINNKEPIKHNLKRLLGLYETSNNAKKIPQSKKISSPISKTALNKVSSEWIIRENEIEYIGWSVFDAHDLVHFENYGYQIPELLKVNTFKYSILKEIGASLFFNIFNSTNQFNYLNIGDINTDLVSGITQLLELDDSQVYNYKLLNLVNVKTRNTKFSLITIFMNASHFKSIKDVFSFVYEICDNGGYLLIREYDLPSHQRDKAFLYETFYNLYSILYKEIDIDTFVKKMKPLKSEYKNILSKYRTRHEWIELISSFGFKPVALNIPYDATHYYDPIYLLFTK
jgi:hypothetical protein